ncbi:molecular chaperone [Paraburkholderia sp. Ac-20342]|uniref:fimbrial biogenesis chaperone n=1 Tax=Paraburkholderia sp. Ac-20342 TaxID=2703889 RepID=UPI00197E9563|nr:molecular chaperone [Paraburkholderia sp. Ac-20342]MBN3846951.1 molecular chaperone [Paraburkholderia sp. Ac-20342]
MPISTILRYLSALVTAATLTWSASANASITLSGTRLVFDGKYKEASLAVRNGNSNILVQAWIESNTPNDEGELPLAVTPALAKMRPDGQQLLRVLYAGGKNALPQDKESVFWLNVQEIPEGTNSAGSLQVAVLQRIKVFFRPKGLAGNVADAPGALTWSIARESGKPMLQITNPTAYHVSLSNISVGAGKRLPATMIAPGETVRLPFDGAGSKLTFSSINDYGGADKFEATLSDSSPVTAQAVIS